MSTPTNQCSCILGVCPHPLTSVLDCRCVCVSGRTAADGKSCVNETGFLIVGGKKKIRFLSANPFSRPPPFKTINRRLRNVMALDIDFESHIIYFADSTRRAAIKAVYLNGTGMRVVIGGM